MMGTLYRGCAIVDHATRSLAPDMAVLVATGGTTAVAGRVDAQRPHRARRSHRIGRAADPPRRTLVDILLEAGRCNLHDVLEENAVGVPVDVASDVVQYDCLTSPAGVDRPGAPIGIARPRAGRRAGGRLVILPVIPPAVTPPISTTLNRRFRAHELREWHAVPPARRAVRNS
jgi:hypothetical protein